MTPGYSLLLPSLSLPCRNSPSFAPCKHHPRQMAWNPDLLHQWPCAWCTRPLPNRRCTRPWCAYCTAPSPGLFARAADCRRKQNSCRRGHTSPCKFPRGPSQSIGSTKKGKIWIDILLEKFNSSKINFMRLLLNNKKKSQIQFFKHNIF